MNDQIKTIRETYAVVQTYINSQFTDESGGPTVREFMAHAGPSTPAFIRAACDVLSGRIAEVATDHMCDQCGLHGAVADAASRRGWGYFCAGCFTDLGCNLGMGRGQVLFNVSKGE